MRIHNHLKLTSVLILLNFYTLVGLFLISILYSNLCRAQNSCFTLFNFSIILGIPVEINRGTKVQEGVYFLGEGKTSKVYRVVLENKTQIEKVYKEERHLLNDLLAAKFLVEILGDNTVASIKKHPKASKTLVVDNFFGEDIMSIWKNNRDHKDQQRLITEYNDIVDHWSKLIAIPRNEYTVYYFDKRQLESGFMSLYIEMINLVTGESFLIHIKPDNVLMTAHHELKIFDPH